MGNCQEKVKVFSTPPREQSSIPAIPILRNNLSKSFFLVLDSLGFVSYNVRRKQEKVNWAYLKSYYFLESNYTVSTYRS